MADFLFYVFAALTLGSAALVVLSKNAVNCAMFMILSLMGMAALFLLLDAYFLAALQVLVYAGAVMVLFVFILMLLDVSDPVRHLPSRPVLLTALGGFVILCAGSAALFFLHVDGAPPPAIPPAGGEAHAMSFATSPRAFGYALFTKYLLPLQLAGFLLLVAMVGVIVLSKRLVSPPVRHQTVEAAGADKQP